MFGSTNFRPHTACTSVRPTAVALAAARPRARAGLAARRLPGVRSKDRALICKRRDASPARAERAGSAGGRGKRPADSYWQQLGGANSRSKCNNARPR
jgi:hypothetical protein